MARSAVSADRLMAMSVRERYDIAWSAIAEELCAAEEPPHRNALVQAGWQAIYRHVRDGLRQRGYGEGERDWSSAESTMPRFVMFWGPSTTPSHEDRIVERLAAYQVLPVLSGIYRDAVVALAVHDDYMRAAEALGIRYEALVARMGVARRRFLVEWYEGETPHRTRRTDRRVEKHGQELATHCGNGHEWTPENTRGTQNFVRGKLRRRRFCRACESARSTARYAAKRAALAASTEESGSTLKGGPSE
jgi:hypothetical protein